MRCVSANKKGFIAYICAGDPNLKATAALARALEHVGVDVLELGVPFSDPLADGVVNQLAAERALHSGTTLNGVLKTVAELRRTRCQMPIVFYVYFNLHSPARVEEIRPRRSRGRCGRRAGAGFAARRGGRDTKGR